MVEQPERAETDGRVHVAWTGEHLTVMCCQNGEETTIRMSRYNAWRVFGFMALMLGISLPKKLQESIRL